MSGSAKSFKSEVRAFVDDFVRRHGSQRTAAEIASVFLVSQELEGLQILDERRRAVLADVTAWVQERLHELAEGDSHEARP